MSNKLKKTLVGFFLFLLGNFSWQYFFAPMLDPIFGSFFNSKNPILMEYIDFVYSVVSRGTSGNGESLFVHNFILIGIVIYLCFNASSFLKSLHLEINDAISSGNHTTNAVNKKKFQFWSFLFISIIISLSSVWVSLQSNYVFSVQVTTLNNIEVVSPYIPDSEYKRLRSAFYSMNSRDDYNNLVSKINRYAQKYNLSLKQ